METSPIDLGQKPPDVEQEDWDKMCEYMSTVVHNDPDMNLCNSKEYVLYPEKRTKSVCFASHSLVMIHLLNQELADEFLTIVLAQSIRILSVAVINCYLEEKFAFTGKANLPKFYAWSRLTDKQKAWMPKNIRYEGQSEDEGSADADTENLSGPHKQVLVFGLPNGITAYIRICDFNVMEKMPLSVSKLLKNTSILQVFLGEITQQALTLYGIPMGQPWLKLMEMMQEESYPLQQWTTEVLKAESRSYRRGTMPNELSRTVGTGDQHGLQCSVIR
jgi:hypothetical protein